MEFSSRRSEKRGDISSYYTCIARTFGSETPRKCPIFRRNLPANRFMTSRVLSSIESNSFLDTTTAQNQEFSLRNCESSGWTSSAHETDFREKSSASKWFNSTSSGKKSAGPFTGNNFIRSIWVISGSIVWNEKEIFLWKRRRSCTVQCRAIWDCRSFYSIDVSDCARHILLLLPFSLAVSLSSFWEMPLARKRHWSEWPHQTHHWNN